MSEQQVETAVKKPSRYVKRSYRYFAVVQLLNGTVEVIEGDKKNSLIKMLSMDPAVQAVKMVIRGYSLKVETKQRLVLS